MPVVQGFSAFRSFIRGNLRVFPIIFPNSASRDWFEAHCSARHSNQALTENHRLRAENKNGFQTVLVSDQWWILARIFS